jgi:hypothetical protein
MVLALARALWLNYILVGGLMVGVCEERPQEAKENRGIFLNFFF